MDGPQGFHLGLGWGSAGVGPTNKVKRPIFRDYVSFREGTSHKKKNIIENQTAEKKTLRTIILSFCYSNLALLIEDP